MNVQQGIHTSCSLHWACPKSVSWAAILCAVLLTHWPNAGITQTRNMAGTFYPTAYHHYSVSDGLPAGCIQQAIVDAAGRIQFSICGFMDGSFPSPIYQFDGNGASPVRLDLGHKVIAFLPKGVDDTGRLFGEFRFREAQTNYQKAMFIYDPANQSTRILEETRFGNEKLDDLCFFEGAYFMLTSLDSVGRIYRMADQGKPQLLRKFMLPSTPPDDLVSHNCLGITSHDFWIANRSRIIQISKGSDKIIVHPVRRIDNDIYSSISTGKDGSVWIGMSDLSVMKWEPSSRTMIQCPGLPEGWRPEELTLNDLSFDQKGNVVVLYQRRSSEIHASLFTPEGRTYDYSRIFQLSGEINRYSRLYGQDFTRSAILSSNGFFYVDVTEGKLIQAVPSIENPRSIVESSTGQLLIAESAKGIHILDGEYKQFVRKLCTKDIIANDKEWAQQGDGTLWACSGPVVDSGKISILVHYDPVGQACDTLDTGVNINQLGVSPEGVVYFLAEQHLYAYKPDSRQLDLVSTFQIPGNPTHVFAGNQRTIWITTSDGLFRVDLISSSIRRITFDFPTSPLFQRIHEDSQGRLWIGTMNMGILLYDPSSGRTRVIDKKKGLLNNTVPSILEDEDGVIWAGTFDGINLIDQNGTVIGKLTEADGLTNNECNRWSQRRLKDGRLAFGAVKGINIIDPNRWKAHYQSRVKPIITLTSVVSNDPNNANRIIDHLDTYLAGERIRLSARNRSIQLGFSLSDYASPELCNYAYKLDLPGEDWRLLGSERSLSLLSLPAGTYNILVRGADRYGRWTEDDIVIPVFADRFVYQKWWFYLLLAMPFLAGGLLWIYRQRQEKKMLEAEVLKRTATIREQSEKLREMDHLKSQLYTNITHEFRTPLTVIMGMAEEIRTHTEEEQTRHHTEVVRRNSAHLLNLVNQMLSLRKLESGTMPLQPVRDDIIRFLRYLMDSFRSLASIKRIAMHFDPPRKELTCDFDPEKMRQIISNLLSNAIKFTPEHGTITLSIEQGGDEENPLVCIGIRDTGIGIPEDKLPYIFERFYQVDNSSTRRGEGTGIGLTLSYELARLMQGSLTVISQVGQGTSFVLTFPFSNTAMHEDARTWTDGLMVQSSADAPSSLPVPGQGTTSSDKPTILLVEDHEDVIHYLVRCLDSDFHLQVARDGEQGIARAIELIPDLIISDVMMPQKDGFELCQTLKERKETSHIPIILLTAKADVESRITGLRRGADAYLAKPFHKEELLVRAMQLIQGRKRLQERYRDIPASPIPTTDDPYLQVEDAFIIQFRETVESDMGNDQLDADTLAVRMDLSRSQLHRKLKALTGKTTMELVKEIRLARACELLKDPDMTISEIAYAVGFRYPETFTRAFQETYSSTPSDWRKHPDKTTHPG